MIFRTKNERAQGLAEYAIIAALIVVATIGISSAMSPTIRSAVDEVNESLKSRGIRLVMNGEQVTFAATIRPTSTAMPQPTQTSTPPPTPTSTPLPTAEPTDDGCATLHAAHAAAVDAYQSCGGGFWRCWTQYNNVLRTYFALQNAHCE